jgi:hypothetical protein
VIPSLQNAEVSKMPPKYNQLHVEQREESASLVLEMSEPQLFALDE